MGQSERPTRDQIIGPDVDKVICRHTLIVVLLLLQGSGFDFSRFYGEIYALFKIFLSMLIFVQYLVLPDCEK